MLALDARSGRRVDHRAGERFAFASANKAFIAAAVLATATDAQLEEEVRYRESDLLEYAPITARHVDAGMTVRALIDAALRHSDNTAANLLVEHLGGTTAVQRFLRGLGDRTTSVDRLEPALNDWRPGERRDTSTPAAFAQDLQRALLGSALPEARRAQLLRLMTANTTGGPYIRAGVPDGWRVADKTGSGGWGTRNDVAVVTPPDGAPIVLVLLSHRRSAGTAPQDGLLAEATRAALRALGR